MINHGGNQGATHDAAGHKSRKDRPDGRAKIKSATGKPRGGLPRVIRQVTAEGGADGSAHMPI